MNMKKLGLITMGFAIIMWLLLEMIGYFIAMTLRPKMITVLVIVFCLGLLIFSIDQTVSMLSMHSGKIVRMILAVVFEFIMVMVVVGLCFFNFMFSPVETEVKEGLKLDYYNLEEAKVYSEYNWFYYR